MIPHGDADAAWKKGSTMTKEDIQLLVDWFDKNQNHKITFLEKEAVKLVLKKADTVGELADTVLKLLKK
jgi:hypothetical protein